MGEAEETEPWVGRGSVRYYPADPSGLAIHDGITIRIAQPAFPMIGAALPIRRIAMPRHNDFDSHFRNSSHCRVEVVNLKPQKHAISVRLGVGIADWAVMVKHLPSVQLHDQSVMRNQPFHIRGRHAHSHNQAAADTNDYSSRHRVRK